MTMARTLKLYKLADQPATAGIRPMVAEDVGQVQRLLADYLGGFKLAPQLDEHEIRHWCVCQHLVIDWGLPSG
jgi:glycylpeptide N-tetradecanoyltransferase